MTQRPPAACSSMSDIRECIDALDRDIVEALGRRMGYIARAAEIKQRDGLAAYIPERVEEVIRNAKVHAADCDFPEELAEQLWTQLVEWSVAHEDALLKAPGENAG